VTGGSIVATVWMGGCIEHLPYSPDFSPADFIAMITQILQVSITFINYCSYLQVQNTAAEYT
jgi:hypothetical protein